MPMTIAELMSKLPSAFLPEKAVGVDAILQFNFTGTDAGSWYATIRDGKCSLAQGSSSTARMTLTADSGDFVRIITGQLDGMQAFMQGKLKLAGDISLATKLLSMFKMS